MSVRAVHQPICDPQLPAENALIKEVHLLSEGYWLPELASTVLPRQPGICGVGAHAVCRVGTGALRPPHPSKNPACEFPRTGLKPFKGRSSDPVTLPWVEQPLRYSQGATCPALDGRRRGCAGSRHVGLCLLSPSLLRVVLPAFSQRSTCWTWAPFRAGHVRPVSDSLQAGLGFFQHPVPHPPGPSSRLACLQPMAAVPERLWPPKRGEKIGPCSGRNDPGQQRAGRPEPGRKDRAHPSFRQRYEVSTFRLRSPRGGRRLLSIGCHD